ncbi:MAG: PhoH family protein [Burkholderiaceae bacterium]
MPLPKAPTKPATSLKRDEAVLAKAARPKKAAKPVEEDTETPAPPSAKVVALQPSSPRPSPAKAFSAGSKAELPVPTQGSTKHKKKGPAGPKKMFVLDTNVLMHDPMSLFRFEEHDVYLPMTTLEELDGHKKGMSEVARNVRTVSRNLDALIEAQAGAEQHLDRGIALDGIGHSDATGRLYFQTEQLEMPSITGLATFKADNLILGVVKALKVKQPNREIVLVSKDINIRIKAHAMGLPAEDYFNDQVIDDADLLYTGSLQLPPDFWETHGKNMESWQQGGTTFYRVTGPMCTGFHVNQFLWDESANPLHATVTEVTGRTAVLQVLRDYSHTKNAVWGITARNREQAFALSLLMNPEIDFVTLLGQAGTGKTLLALAAGLAQTLETKIYSEIIVTRATVSIGEDIGFLPGTEEEKMQPWMGALEDNLEVLNKGSGVGGEWGRSAATDLIKSRIKVKSMNFMRGRTFINKFLIIDEAQNLTPKQMKALITRAGPGTKVVCMGNIAQIDTPYLTEGSSGLTYTVDRFKGWAHGGHVTLQRGERSRLADFASDIL